MFMLIDFLEFGVVFDEIREKRLRREEETDGHVLVHRDFFGLVVIVVYVVTDLYSVQSYFESGLHVRSEQYLGDILIQVSTSRAWSLQFTLHPSFWPPMSVILHKSAFEYSIYSEALDHIPHYQIEKDSSKWKAQSTRVRSSVSSTYIYFSKYSKLRSPGHNTATTSCNKATIVPFPQAYLSQIFPISTAIITLQYLSLDNITNRQAS